MSANTWQCPVCQRRVPVTLGECRCGTARPSASRADEGRDRLPWDVKVWLTVVVFAFVLGIYQSLQPFEQTPIIPLLGFGPPDRPPTPIPGKAPRPKAAPSKPR